MPTRTLAPAPRPTEAQLLPDWVKVLISIVGVAFAAICAFFGWWSVKYSKRQLKVAVASQEVGGPPVELARYPDAASDRVEEGPPSCRRSI